MHNAMLVTVLLGLSCSQAQARETIWQPSPDHSQVPIWPGAVPDAMPNPKPESLGPPAGREWWPRANDVSRPTMTAYAPVGRNTGVAIVVFPGGGYQFLAMDSEGTEICDWLTSRGITCILRAKEWHIDAHKIGVIGFSAGGHLAAAVSTRFDRRSYPPIDAADALSCRPDFAIVVYPGHLWTPGTELTLRSDIRVRADTPPTFLLHAEDDPIDPVKHSLTYYAALQKAGIPTEMHLFAQGGHAFGVRPSKLPIAQWPHLVETWLVTIGMVDAEIAR